MDSEQMKKNFGALNYLKNIFMRDFTEEEENYVLEKGGEDFLQNKIGLGPEEFNEFLELRSLISTYFTQGDAEYEKALKEIGPSTYFTLKEFVSDLEHTTEKVPCTKEVKQKVENRVEEFSTFLQDLYNSLNARDSHWFNNLTDQIRKNLFDFYNQEVGKCSTDTLCGNMTDAVKDQVIQDFVKRLKNKETVEMSNDQYLEVADYLCETEDQVCLFNDNGKVTLK